MTAYVRDLEVAGERHSPSAARYPAHSLASWRRKGAPPPQGGRRILLVETHAQIAGTLAEQLRADGFQVDLALTAEHARALARARRPQLFLLGTLDPERDTIELLDELRQGHQASSAWAPAVVLGARSDQLDVLRAFEAGADDFVARPVDYLELRARVRALLRRADCGCSRTARVEIGPLAIDQRRRAVSLHGDQVELRRMEFELLLHLATDPQRVFAKHELLRAVWGYRSSGSTRTLDSHASRLRRKLECHSHMRWVINVWGVGYRLR
jgi:DNA-binding response OmpR family regulator